VAERDKARRAGPAEPFRIAGNLYYVGATDAAAFLITGPEGHIVLDGGYPSTAPMIIASIAKLGFSIKDVRVLLNSEPHPDHAGGLGVLQQASGAELWASEASAYTLASGGDDPDGILPLRALARIGVVGAPGHAGRPPVQGRRHNPPRAARTHRAHHRRPHARLHLMVVPRS
jgi:metallo-beta-lactamase class B